MGSFKRPRVFDPLDLEIIDRVYEAAWAQIEASEPERNPGRDADRQQTLRKQIFAVAGRRPVDFDDLYERVMAVLRSSEVKVACPPIAEDLRQSFTD
jgi:hypothetical protein